MTAPVVTRLLLTGFGRFPGARKNPSSELAQALALRSRARLGIDLRTLFLSVEFCSIASSLASTLERLQPDAVLHLGLAGRRRQVSVELCARNWISPLHPDAAGKSAPSRFVQDGGGTLKTSLPAARLAATLRRHGVPARLSSNAGSYVCNQTFYQSLAWAGPRRALAGFIHVPRRSIADEATVRALPPC